MRKGSMTVFMGMSLMLILSVFFSLLELIHYQALKKESVIVTKIGIESMFADYNRPMWDKFKILGMDAGYCDSDMHLEKTTEKILSYLEANLTLDESQFGGNHLVMTTNKCEVSGYTLITDRDGEYFIKQCSNAALGQIPQDAIDSLKEKADSISEDASSEIDIDSMLEEGNLAIENEKSKEESTEGSIEADMSGESGDVQSEVDDEQSGAAGENGTNKSNAAGGTGKSREDDTVEDETSTAVRRPEDVEGGLSETEISSAGNPIESISSYKGGGILSQVTPEGMEISESTFSGEKMSDRNVNKGTVEAEVSIGVTDRLLYEYYLVNKFGCCSDTKERDGMCYELEYILSGKDSDADNLESVAIKLLALRSAANLGSLMSDATKLAQVESLALSLAGISANPVVIELVKGGIIAAWVYVESVLDVRTLLSGGKIAIVKTTTDWTSTLPTLGTCLSNSYKAKESESGISYKSYLGAMLLLLSDKDSSYRAMDLIENEVRTQEDYSNFRMDNVIVYAELETGYEAFPVFGSLVTIGSRLGNLSFACNEKLGYTD